MYWSRIAALDTIGVALAGSVEAPPRILEEVLELGAGDGPSLILGSNRRVGALDAKFSVQYCVLRALLDGKVVPEHFDEGAWGDPAMRALLKRVHAAPYTKPLFDPKDPFDAEVTVTLVDGRSFTAHVDRPLGRTSEIPIPPENLRAKFENCAARVLAPKAVAAVTRAIEAFEEVKSVREFTKLLENDAGKGLPAYDTAGARREAVRSFAG